jgi:rhamnogalacturonyl hydrolase YesR
MITALVTAAALAAIDDSVGAVAALRGQPSIVSAAGITRRDTRILTLENPSPFEPSPARRLVLIGGLDGDEGSARAVLDALRWFKMDAPAEMRGAWSVSALPLADPDRVGVPMEFPPDTGFFNDAERPESRYVWRWIVYQAPDCVIVFSERGSPAAASLRQALARSNAAGLGPVSVPDTEVSSAEAFRAWLTAATGRMKASPMHEAIAARVARNPLAIARVLARRYPETAAISYIPALAWVNTLRLATLTGDDALRQKVMRQLQPWLTGEKKLFGERIQLTGVAGTMVFAELARAGNTAARRLAAEGVPLAAARKPSGIAEYSQGWTDDMFMAASILARAGGDDLDRAARLLIDYAARLQRADGLFNHASDAPAAWGRGNGFAAFGVMEALTVMGSNHPLRADLLEIYRRHVDAVREHQAPDGMWREVIDEPGAYREETATAMLLTALARGVRLGWIDRSYRSAAERAWRALAAHIADEGTLIDVCASTGGGPTRRYYLDRPAISGADDRGGAMALQAAIEFHDLSGSVR